MLLCCCAPGFAWLHATPYKQPVAFNVGSCVGINLDKNENGPERGSATKGNASSGLIAGTAAERRNSSCRRSAVLPHECTRAHLGTGRRGCIQELKHPVDALLKHEHRRLHHEHRLYGLQFTQWTVGGAQELFRRVSEGAPRPTVVVVKKKQQPTMKCVCHRPEVKPHPSTATL